MVTNCDHIIVNLLPKLINTSLPKFTLPRTEIMYIIPFLNKDYIPAAEQAAWPPEQIEIYLPNGPSPWLRELVTKVEYIFE